MLSILCSIFLLQHLLNICHDLSFKSQFPSSIIFEYYLNILVVTKRNFYNTTYVYTYVELNLLKNMTPSFLTLFPTYC